MCHHKSFCYSAFISSGACEHNMVMVVGSFLCCLHWRFPWGFVDSLVTWNDGIASGESMPFSLEFRDDELWRSPSVMFYILFYVTDGTCTCKKGSACTFYQAQHVWNIIWLHWIKVLSECLCRLRKLSALITKHYSCSWHQCRWGQNLWLLQRQPFKMELVADCYFMSYWVDVI